VTELQHRIGPDGEPVVEARVHVSPEQAAACADAVQAVIGARYRVPSLSVDEILTMRELTALGDAFDDLRSADGVSVVPMSIARLGLLRDAIADAPPGPAHALLDALDDLHADALRAALGAQGALT